MSSSHGMTAENLLRMLPDVLKNDVSMLALATPVADDISLIADQTKLATIYARIDELPEKVLDTLAVDFKVDWYDYDVDITAKRQLIKDCVRVHKRLGTKYAIKTALAALHPGAYVEEWFEYGGDPHFFRVVLSNYVGGVDKDTYDKVVSTIDRVKRLSSWLDELVIEHEPMTRKLYITPIMGRGHMVTHMPEIEYYEEITHTLRVSAVAHSISLTRLPEIEPPKEMGLLIDKDGLVFLAKDGPFLVEIE